MYRKLPYSLLAVIKMILENLILYNPYLNLYLSISDRRPIITGRYEYYNYLHQVALYSKLFTHKNTRLLIADEVGLGKTVEAIRIIKYCLLLKPSAKILIIVPASLLEQWIDQDLTLLGIPNTRVIDEHSIDELYNYYKIHGEIPSGVYIGSMDKLKFSMNDSSRIRHKPYYDLVSSIKWDLVVIDEAHRLTSTSSRTTSLRYKRLGKICMDAENCVLLTATPSSGDPRDFINRLKLLDLSINTKRIRRNIDLEKRFYETISDVIVIRRSKEYVNRAEKKDVFPPLESYVVVVDVNEDEKKFYDSKLPVLLAKLLKQLESGRETGILKTLLLKRALSSPQGFYKTLNKIVSGRVEEKITGNIEDLVDEYEPDIIEDKYIPILHRRIRGRVYELLVEILREYSRIQNSEFGDSKYTTLLKLLFEQEVFPSGDYIVFSEYKDTIDYLYRGTIEYLSVNGSSDATLLIEVISEAIEEYCSFNRGTICRMNINELINKIREYVAIYNYKSTRYLVIKLSSSNKWMIPLIHIIISVFKEVGNSRVILYSTDIASEGLNLHLLNIVINYDIPWSPLRREQRIGRVYRLRQGRKCIVIDLVRNTRLEYRLYSILLHKLFNMVWHIRSGREFTGIIKLSKRNRGIAIKPVLLNSIDDSEVLSRIGEAFTRSYNRGVFSIEAFTRYLDELINELANYLAMFNYLVKTLEKHLITPEELEKYSRDLFSVSSHSNALQKIKRLYSTLREYIELPVVGRGDRLDEYLVAIWNTLTRFKGLDYMVFLYNCETSWDEAFLGFADMIDRDNGFKRYTLPVMIFIKYGDEGNISDLDVIYGFDVLDWIAQNIHNLSSIGENTLYYSIPEHDTSLYKVIDKLLYVKLFKEYMSRWIHREVTSIKKYRGIVGENSEITPVNLDVRINRDVKIILIPVRREEQIVEAPGEPCSGYKRFLEEYSTKLVEEIYSEKGYEVVEEHICEPSPYDLLLKDQYGDKLYVEVKSHAQPVFTARMTRNEAEFAEKNLDKYHVCLVTGVSVYRKPLIICMKYRDLAKKPVYAGLREVIIYFNKTNNIQVDSSNRS